MGGSIARYRLLIGSLRVFDIVAVTTSFALAAILASPDIQLGDLAQFFSLRLRVSNVAFFIGSVLGWIYLLTAYRLYANTYAQSTIRMLLRLAAATLLGSCLFWVIAHFLELDLVNMRFMASFTGMLFASCAIARLVLAYVLHRRTKGEGNLIEFLVVGVNQRSMNFIHSAESDVQAPRRFLGFVDVGVQEIKASADGRHYSYLTDIKYLREFLRATPVDEVVIGLPLKSYYDETSEVVSICKEQGITVRILTDIFQTDLTRSRIEEIGHHTLTTVVTHQITGAKALVKRGMDIVFGTAILVILAPVFVIASLLNAVTSPGPVLFSQERVGLNKKIFRMLKFRSMVAEAEMQQAALESINEAQGPVFKIRHDPRITPVGRFLRKTSIDELPQLINVIKGDMSLVGPRPLPLRDYAGFKEDWHRRRLSVRPGITGLWQVKDRNHKSFDRWMQLDMQYIDGWSIWMDLKILVQTVPAVLRGSGE